MSTKRENSSYAHLELNPYKMFAHVCLTGRGPYAFRLSLGVTSLSCFQPPGSDGFSVLFTASSVIIRTRLPDPHQRQNNYSLTQSHIVQTDTVTFAKAIASLTPVFSLHCLFWYRFQEAPYLDGLRGLNQVCLHLPGLSPCA